MKLEVNEDNFQTWLSETKSCRDIVFVSLDLRPSDAQLAALDQAGSSEEACVFLGCTMGPLLSAAVASTGAPIFPNLPGQSFDAFRARMYTVEELFKGYNPGYPEGYKQTLDWRTYESYMVLDANGKPLRPPELVKVGPEVLMARRLHDHSITMHMARFLATYDPRHTNKRGVIAVMGGHDVKRSAESFKEIALLSRELTIKGFLIVSGGGPGLMEAANLGAYLAPFPESAVITAIDNIKGADTYDHVNWLSTAWQVRTDFKPPSGSQYQSLGIPTWWYGHEPPNVFATRIAKYFENSLREEGLLAIATHGIIYGDGNAGTVQEIFQDACQNYYATYGYASPMVLYGSDFWDLMPSPKATEKGGFLPKSKPAWALLRNLARLGNFEHLVTLTDDRAKAISVFESFRIKGQPEPSALQDTVLA